MQLSETVLRDRAEHLAAGDPALGAVVERHGYPPLWGREPTFATLIHLILEQQVSLASAQAAMDRLVASIGRPAPSALLALDDGEMRAIGFSRQKRDYARGVARRIEAGDLDLAGLSRLPDEEVRSRLIASKGIGIWTADIFLLMALGRPDIWPTGDRALVVAARELRGAQEDPSNEQMLAMADSWRPWRSVAARILWHFYLSEIRPPKGAGNSPTPATLTSPGVS